jgi:hypothetical protein
VYDLCWAKETSNNSNSSSSTTTAATTAAATHTAKRRRGAPPIASIDSWCLAQADAVEQKVLVEQQALAAAHSSGRGASYSPVRQRRSGNAAAAQRITTTINSIRSSSSGPDLAGCIAVLLTDTYGVRSLIVQACIDLLAVLESARSSSSSSSSTGTEADDTDSSSSSSAYAQHCAVTASTFSLLLRGLRSSAAGSLLLLARAAAVQTLSAGPYNGALGSVTRLYTGLALQLLLLLLVVRKSGMVRVTLC